MRILVCGGRDYDNWGLIHSTLNGLNPTVIINGGAPGADRLSSRWADINNTNLIEYPALWKQGRKAGPMRNAFMLADSRPDLVVAFPGGPGTRDMINKATAAGIEVREIK